MLAPNINTQQEQAFMRWVLAGLIIMLLGLPGVPGNADEEAEAIPSPTQAQGHIKRVALRVPDLDRGIRFFSEVIGFRLDMQFTMEPGADPYFPLVFNVSHDKPIRMALFSTAAEPRGLFLAEFPDMAVPEPDKALDQVMVLEVPDMAAVRKRAHTAGFDTADPQEGTAPDGTRFSEMLIIGPGRHRVLVFQYFKP